MHQGAGGRYLLCASCGFVYADIDEEAWDALNESEFEESLDGYVERSFAPKKLARYRQKLARLEPYRGTGRLLEVGANVGGFLSIARDAGWTTVGVEPVDACARHARDVHGLDVRTSTLEAAGLDGANFDVAYANAVFEHLYDPPRTLAAIVRALRPGGVVFIDTVNYASTTRERIGAGWKLFDPVRHVCLYTPATLKRLCTDVGLEPLALTSHRVRLRPNREGRLRGVARGLEELRKLPLGLAARWRLKGESIAVLARKPAGSARHG